MKHAFRFFLSLMLLLSLLLSTASANSWGLSGGLITLVEDNPDYKDYTSVTDNYSKNRYIAQFVMHSRYHNQLFSARKESGQWIADVISTTAVYQPGETSASPKLTATASGFTLAYKKLGESYTFALATDDWGNSFYKLTSADMGEVTLREGDTGYIVTLGNDSAVWYQTVTLDNFNIAQMPHRGPEDVRRMNAMNNGLGYMAEISPSLLFASSISDLKGQKCPVYSAPQTDSWRAANGKASVVPDNSTPVYDMVDNWALVEYSVSLRTSRFGWIYTGKARSEDTIDWMVRVPARTACETFITDDPYVSQYAQATLAANSAVTVLGYLSSESSRNWAYIYAEVTVDGVLMRGFIPMRDLVWDDVLLEDKRAEYAGSWQMDGGSEIYYEYLVLAENGCVYASDRKGMQPCRGTWDIVQNIPGSNLWWVDSADTLVLTGEDGFSRRFGIITQTDEEGNRSLSLIYGEGGCGYMAVPDMKTTMDDAADDFEDGFEDDFEDGEANG